mgnify:CR=1 FL=1
MKQCKFLMVKFMIAYTGGKTAGHVMPLISIIKENNENAIYVLEETFKKTK